MGGEGSILLPNLSSPIPNSWLAHNVQFSALSFSHLAHHGVCALGPRQLPLHLERGWVESGWLAKRQLGLTIHYFHITAPVG